MRLALVAGGGRLPEAVSERVPDRVLLSLEQGDYRLGAVDQVLQAARDAGCDHLCFAGSVRRTDFRDLDAGARWIAARAGVGAGDSRLLDALVAYAEAQGFAVLGVNSLCADLLTPAGLLCGGAAVPSAEACGEGLDRARQLGAADEGQAVVRAGDQWLVEDAAGTNALISRAGACHPGRDKALFKAAKPQQDLRVDLPAWGLETVEAAADAEVSTLVFEAGRTIGLDRAAALAAAEAAGITIVGVEA